MFGLRDVKNDISSIRYEIDQIKLVSQRNAEWVRENVASNRKFTEEVKKEIEAIKTLLDDLKSDQYITQLTLKPVANHLEKLTAQIDEFRLLVRKKPGRKKKYAPRKKDENQ